jgi:hypothetical protein
MALSFDTSDTRLRGTVPLSLLRLAGSGDGDGDGDGTVLHALCMIILWGLLNHIPTERGALQAQWQDMS